MHRRGRSQRHPECWGSRSIASFIFARRERFVPKSRKRGAGGQVGVFHVGTCWSSTERVIARDLPGFVLPDSLTERGAPELRVIITDDRRIFFALHAKGRAPQLLGGVDLKADSDGRSKGLRKNPPKGGRNTPEPTFNPSVHERGRVEVSVTGLARDLSRTLKEE
jgi:hypothetical protein